MNQYNLKGIYEEIWDYLDIAVKDRKSGFHTFSLATISNGYPDNRTVVLRGCCKKTMKLSFHTNNFSGMKKIKQDIDFKSDKWVNSLIKNYFLTLVKAQKISENILNNNACNKTKFFAFYQPISTNKTEKFTKKIIMETKSFFTNKGILIDLTQLIDDSDFIDLVHIKQSAKNVIGNEIFKSIYPYIKEECKL